LGDTIGKDGRFLRVSIKGFNFSTGTQEKVQDDEMTEQFLFDSIEGAEIREEDDE
jgi:hypothetical protein